MSNTAIKVEELSKLYRLGEVGTGTLSHDLNRWIAKLRGKEDPFARIGEVNDRTVKGKTDYVWALKDVNFEVKQGEALGIIGRNGAGKSTLLKILSKVTTPTKGNIKVKGRIASLLEVGTGFHPELTGRENIFLNGAILGMTKDEIKNKFEEIVEFSGVGRYVNTPVKRYSSGMYVRLAFSVAAHLDPDILIIDEVLAVGDIEFQKKCLGKLQDVSSKEGRTVLFVSHNMVAVESLTDRSVVMEKGLVEFMGATNIAVENYFLRISEKSKMELAQRVDRRGNGKLLFTRAWIENSRGNQIEEFVSGDDVSFCVEYETKEDLNNIQLAFGVYSYNEIQITDLWNESAGQPININGEKKGIIRCKVLNMPLNSGSFYFNVYASAFNQVLDSVERVASFNVIQGDYFDSGVMPDPNAGFTLLNQTWEVIR